MRSLDEGRRYATIEDFRNFVKLAYLAPSLHHSGGTICEPVDLPVNKRHFDMVYSHMKYSDKPFMGSVTHPERAQDSVEMAKILFGDAYIDRATGKPKTVIINLINANSPLTFDATMLGAAKVYARANQATIVTPFILAGAMSPVTVAGTCAQTLAEALSGMAFVQLVAQARRSCSAASPRRFRCSPARRRSARRSRRWCSTRWRRSRDGWASHSVRAARCAARRSPTRRPPTSRRTRCVPTCLAGVNFVLHTAGWLEGGLAMGYEKFVMDVDQAGMMHTLLAGIDLSENGQAMDAIREVGPGKHFLGCAHTQANFETAFYRSPIADNNSYEQWEAEGSQDLAQRANASGRSSSRATRPRRSIRRSTRRCSITSIGARRRFRIRSSDRPAHKRARNRAMASQKSADAPSELWSPPGTTCQCLGPAHAS